GKIIQELEAIFRGAGWNVIKVIWGSDWDSLIQNDRDGLLVRRLGEITDGQYQKFFVESGAYFRQNLFGTDPRLLRMVEHLSDEQLSRMRLGGHDPIKVHAAYKAAVEHTGAPQAAGRLHAGAQRPVEADQACSGIDLRRILQRN